MGPSKYHVVLERDASGSWIARVPEIPGCHSYGRTLAQARRRVREALTLWVEDAENAELEERITLPREIRQELRRTSAARRKLERDRTEAHEATARAAETLVHDFRLGLRDAAELLGISHQRVQQLVRE